LSGFGSLVRNTSLLSISQSIVEHAMFLSLTRRTIGIGSHNAIDSDNGIESLTKDLSAHSHRLEDRTILEVHFLLITPHFHKYFASTCHSRRRTIISETFIEFLVLPPTFESFPDLQEREAVYNNTSSATDNTSTFFFTSFRRQHGQHNRPILCLGSYWCASICG